METIKKDEVGGEVVSLCTKCKTATGHNITSKVGEKIAKVRCRECGSTHRYLNPNAPRRSSRRKTTKLTAEEVWNLCVQGVSSKKKLSYTLSGTFKQNDLIDHSHFGLGVVTHVLASDKIQVTFRDGEKTLIMGMISPL